MSDIRELKPVDGALVRRPDTQAPLAAEGEPVEMNSYWRRKLRDGDVREKGKAAKSTNDKGSAS